MAGLGESMTWPVGGLPHGEHPYDYGYREVALAEHLANEEDEDA